MSVGAAKRGMSMSAFLPLSGEKKTSGETANNDGVDANIDPPE
jgi:hypothetical protein